VWIWDVARETLIPLTARGSRSVYPLWTRDGARVAFASSGVWWQAADGSGTPERLAAPSGGSQLPNAFAPDGRLIVTDGDNNNVSVVTPGSQSPTELLIGRPGMSARNAEIAPDGRLLAYETNESGQFQVVVRTFPDVNAGRWQVSTAGGTRPLWSRDGRELFYVPPDGGIMRVQVTQGSSVGFGALTRLLTGPYSWSVGA